MKKKLIILVLAVLGFSSTFVSVALATTSDVGGGVWNRWVTPGMVNSHYYHRTVKHGSTACKNGADCVGVNVSKNVESKASKSKKIWEGGTRVYWHKN